MKKLLPILTALLILASCQTSRNAVVHSPPKPITLIVHFVMTVDSGYETYAKSGRYLYVAILPVEFNRGDTIIADKCFVKTKSAFVRVR